MEILTFEELQSRIQALYREGDYRAALELATHEINRFPEQNHLLAYWRMAMFARLGEIDQSIEQLEQVLKTGFWYGDVFLRRSPSMQPLQGNPEFERLVDWNHELQEADHSKIFPLIVLRSQDRCQAGGPLCPLLMGLHENGSTAQDSVDFWRPAAMAGWLVAVPQSSQPMWKGAYVWDNREITKQETQKHFADLTEKYAVDRSAVVLAGHGMGGEAALRMALTGAIAARGFIAVSPAGPLLNDLEGWEELVRDQVNPSLRGYIILGEEDEAVSHDAVEDLVERLNMAGIFCDLEEVPHAGHDFAPEYESSLIRGLEFITD